ncbi:MAG TPA: YfhO family protein [bacterium]|nr:YfhO family protein [bacterium]
MRRILLILLILVGAYYAKAIVAPPAQMIGWEQSDTREQYFQWRQYGFGELRAGRLPFWNRYAYCGTPFMANVQTALFYPPNAIFLVMKTARAINWSFIIHALIAAAGIALFLRRLGVPGIGQLCGGITFVFSAPFICQVAVGHLTLINTIAWTGFIFWAVLCASERPSVGRAVTIAVFAALALLAGNTHNFFYLTIAGGLYTIFLAARKMSEQRPSNPTPLLLCFGGGMALAAGMCAFQLLPALELGSHSARQGATYEFCATFSFTPESILTFLMPEFYGNTFHTPYWGRFSSWELCAYCGTVSFILALAAFTGLKDNTRRATVIFFGGAAALSFILALGGYTPLFRLLYNYVPGFNLFRGNSKFIFLTAFSLSVLSGIGAGRLFSPSEEDAAIHAHRTRLALVTAVFIIAAGSVFALCRLNGYALWERFFMFIHNLPFNLHQFPRLAERSSMGVSYGEAFLQFIRCAVLAAAFCGIFWIRSTRTRTYVLIPLILIDLWSFGLKYMFLNDSGTIGIERGPLAYLSKEAKPFRALTPGLPRNFSMVNLVENAEGYDPIVLRDYYEYAAFSQGAGASDLAILLQSTVPLFTFNKFTDLLNAKYLLLPAGIPFQANPAFIEEAYRDDGNVLLRFKNAGDRFLFVNDVRVVPRKETLATMASSSFNPFRSACVDEEPPFQLTAGTTPTAQLSLRSYASETISLDIRAETDGLLVLLDAYYPAWKTTVDGVSQKTYRTDFLFRGVFLRAGSHRIEMRYVPDSFRKGLAVSGASILLACAAALVRMARRKQRR